MMMSVRPPSTLLDLGRILREIAESAVSRVKDPESVVGDCDRSGIPLSTPAIELIQHQEVAERTSAAD